MYIIKASGQREKYQPQKIVGTCLRAGADKKLAQKVIKQLEPHIYDGMPTKEILKLVRKFLAQEHKHVAARYNLKKAIMQMGPSGFNFEKLTERILQEQGYKTSTPLRTQGKCAVHEIDVVAKKDDLSYDIECKYHNAAGIYSGLKTALYVWARHQDLIQGYKSGICPRFDQVWLWCNTKFSSQVIQYAQCADMKLTSWNYPKKDSLRDLLERYKLYPITVIIGLSKENQQKLFKDNIILVQDLIKEDFEKLKNKTKIKDSQLENIVNQAQKIIHGK